MARLLVVRAHPLTSKVSNSMRLTDEFVRIYRETHPDDDITDLTLYNVAIPGIDLDLLNAWKQLRAGVPFVHLHEAEQNKATLFDHYTEQFLGASKIVVANPLWNLQVPTRLKAWIDTICVAGRTFRYNETGGAVGLVQNKRALHIQTAGGIFSSQDPASAYLRTVFGFIGVTDYQQITAEGMDHDPANAETIVDDAMRRVRELAASF